MFAAVLTLALLGCTPSDTPAETGNETATTNVIPDPDEPAEPRRINLGVAAGRRQGQTPIDALIHAEQVASRRFDILRAYSFWDGEFPDLRHEWARAGGRMLHLSINARRTDGSVVPWRTIATAPDGDPVLGELETWVERLASYDGPLRVTFHHEADIEPDFGSPDDFVAAWQRFVTLLDAAAPDIDTVWVLTAFNLGQPTADGFWPGDDYVDLIGGDAFNWYGCRGTPEAWRSPREVLEPLMSFGANHPDKPLVLAELGSDEDSADPERKADWLDELAALVAEDEYRQLDTVVFFHNDHDAESTCDWWLDSAQVSADAFQRLAALPLFGGDVAAPPPDQCPIVASMVSSVDDLALVDGDGDGRFDFEFGDENRFVGIGDQSADGADHRVLLEFGRLDAIPTNAQLELRLRIGERQPLLSSAVELRLLDDFDKRSEAFADPGELLEPSLFTDETVGGHHVVDVTGRIDPSQPVTLRLQLAAPPPTGDGQAALFMGTGNANRSIDRPTLIARHCE